MPAGPVKSVHGAFSIRSLDGIRCVGVLVVFFGLGLTAAENWPSHLGVTAFFFLSVYLYVEIAPAMDPRSLLITLPAGQLLYIGVEKPLRVMRRRLEARLPARSKLVASSV